ncbi:hypothetical protein B296_00055082 [Ensete ventricosum]|uniref:Uncharacterized protein n=1 Tax=Ensete ventricosum TaxID=4639 RepID=A0A426Y175_ENSVE|nr:hypothetical protein B296_00055082 [Ensete ventricosum]
MGLRSEGCCMEAMARVVDPALGDDYGPATMVGPRDCLIAWLSCDFGGRNGEQGSGRHSLIGFASSRLVI